MRTRAPVNRFTTFLVILLLVMLPISTSAQLSAATTVAAAEEQPQQLPNEAEAIYLLQGESEVEPQVWCLWPAKECAGKCSWCWIGSTWYCSSSGGVCCDSSAKFCDSSAGKCWTDNCPAGTKWTCKSTGAVCESVCTDQTYPKYCSGKCWTSCKDDQYKTYKFVCDNPPWCQVVSCIHPTWPNKCGNECWSNCGSGYAGRCASDGKWVCDPVCTDSDGDGYGSGCSKGSDCNDNDASIWKKNSCNVCAKEPSGLGNSCSVGTGACQRTGKYMCDNAGTGTVCDVSPGSPSTEVCDGVDNDCDGETDEGVKNACGGCGAVSSEKCGDNVDNDCDGLVDEGCCSDAQNPYYCGKTGSCWKKPQCDQSISCGGQWWACNEPSKYNAKCVDSKFGCCEPPYPYYCPANNWCFSQDGFCDGRTVYPCGSKYFVCNKKTEEGKCFGDVLRCCPSGESWWESDKQCHKTSEPVKCAVPDGSSANCDCDTDSECAKADTSKPYCGEGGSLYNVRTPQGYHACLTSKPEYCGNGKCAGSENYNNCQSDCGQNAPKGTITTEVVYYGGSQKDKPLQGAYIYLDGIQKGTTGSDGKINFEAAYGSRTIKVNCPDKAFCSEKSVGVDGTEYVSFRCDCKSPVSFSNLRARFKAKTNAYPKGYPVANVDVLIDDSLKGASNQFGAVDIEGLTTGSHQLDVYLKLLEDGQEKIYTGGTSLTLSNPYEEKVYVLVKGNSPSAAYIAFESGNEAFTLQETNVTPELVWIPIIIAVVWVAGTAWDAYDYEKCVERQANAWDPNKEDWNKFQCNTEMDEEQLNDCVTKLLSKNQNTIEGCGFEAGMLALNALPQESIPKTGLKLAVKIGKVVRIIPFIDDAAKGAYRTYRFVRGTESFVTVTDKLNKGAKYVFKLADNSLKIFDNSVGFIVNKIARNPETWKKISEKVDNLLLNTKPKNVPKAFLEDVPVAKGARRTAAQGYLGEKAKDEYIATVKEALEKEGNSVAVVKGVSGDVYATAGDYTAYYTKTGSGIKVIKKKFPKGVEDVGEVDGVMFVNGKPVVIEAKASDARTIAKDLADEEDFFRRKIESIEAVTGQKPEVFLLIPKGEASNSLGFLKPTLSGQIDVVGHYLENKGTHLAYDEFPATRQQFSDAGQRIVDDFSKHGR